MGFLGFLKFVLLCVDFLIWPVCALGYPLFASIRAVETGSKYNMRKLVIYWTLFALISLFEIAFVKVIEWIPFWSCIKLIATCLLVFPRFNAAVEVYQSIVHPCLSMKVQAAISSFYEPKDEKTLMTETLMNIAAERHTKDGSEQNASSEPKPIQHAHSINVGPVKTKTDAPTEFKEMSPRKKVLCEWMCSLCHVTATSENMLSAHIQGKKHKSKLEALVLGQRKEKCTASLPSTKDALLQANCGAAKKGVVEGLQQKPSKNNVEKVPSGHGGAAADTFKLWCGFCKVKLLSDIDMVAHLNGKKHSSTIQKLREFKKPGSCHSDIQVQGPDEQNTAAIPKQQCQVQNAESNSIAGYVKKKVEQEWKCVLCEVTTTSEKTLNSHLQGKKHKTKIEALETNQHNAKIT